MLQHDLEQGRHVHSPCPSGGADPLGFLAPAKHKNSHCKE